MKKTLRAILAGLACLTAGLCTSGCLHDAVYQAAGEAGQAGQSLLNAFNLVFAMQLYVAKTGTTPATVDELREFLQSEGIAIEIAPDWQLKSSIKGGVCEFTFTRAKEETLSDSFPTKNLNYDQTRQQYLEVQKALAPFGQVLVEATSSKP